MQFQTEKQPQGAETHSSEKKEEAHPYLRWKTYIPTFSDDIGKPETNQNKKQITKTNQTNNNKKNFTDTLTLTAREKLYGCLIRASTIFSLKISIGII